MVLGVDALDPTKGLVHKLLAVEELFELYPELAQKVVFVQVLLNAHNPHAVTREHRELEAQVRASSRASTRRSRGSTSTGRSSTSSPTTT